MSLIGEATPLMAANTIQQACCVLQTSATRGSLVREACTLHQQLRWHERKRQGQLNAKLTFIAVRREKEKQLHRFHSALRI